MSSMHFYAWSKGLKTGQYYLRSRAAVDPIKFTLDVEELMKNSGGVDMKGLCSNNRQKKRVKKRRVKKIRKRKKVKPLEEKPVKKVIPYYSKENIITDINIDKMAEEMEKQAAEKNKLKDPSEKQEE